MVNKEDYYKVKLYQFYCDHCHYKQFTDGIDLNLVEVKTSRIQGGTPKLDPATGKKVENKWYKQKRKFKCPECGKTISPRLLTTKIHPMEEVKEDSENQKEIIQNIIDQLKNYGEDHSIRY